MSYTPAIDNLSKIQNDYSIKIAVTGVFLTLTKVKVNLAFKSFTIYIQDEYNDLKINNPLLNLCLVLRELEIYHESTDYLSWCQCQGVDATNNSILQYYIGLESAYNSVEKAIGVIDSQISDIDFQLNTGAALILRKRK